LTDFRLLQAFQSLFEGDPYLHRSSILGDQIASYLYDDLFLLNRSPKYTARVEKGVIAVNAGNRIKGKSGRRGDGTLGEVVPGGELTTVEDYIVKRGPVATLEIGSETKILATKMIAQIDRVMNDLREQSNVFRTHSKDSIRVGIVGVNFSDEYTSHQGIHDFPAKIPPSRESIEVIRRIRENVLSHYDELLFLRFRASNRPPYKFEWVNEKETRLEYGSSLIRISTRYEQVF